MLPKNRKMDNPNTLHMIAARYAFEPSCFDVHHKKINIRDQADKIYQHEHLLGRLFFTFKVNFCSIGVEQMTATRMPLDPIQAMTSRVRKPR